MNMNNAAVWVTVLIAVSVVVGAVWYVNTNPTVPTNEPVLTCEQRIDKITKEFVAIQDECQPVATSTEG